MAASALVIIILTTLILTDTTDTGTFFSSITTSTEISATQAITNALAKLESLNFTEIYNEQTAIQINLNGDTITTSANLEIDEDTTVYIKDGGTYLIKGELSEGQIIIYSEDQETVHLILDNANITSSTGAPISILNAQRTLITLAENSFNYLTDTSQLENDSTSDDTTTAAIYSKDDLYFNGQGNLTIQSTNKNGIQSKDQLVIISGNLDITSAKESIKAKDYILIQNGNFDLTAGEDAIRTTETDDTEKGFILIQNGNFNIQSTRDAIQATTDLIINNGTFQMATSAQSSLTSSKGLKSDANLRINGGTYTIQSTDDGIHSGQNITINNGTFYISSKDDAIHADQALTINSASISITQSVEGLEAQNIYINSGNISIEASDDGINVADSSGETMRAVSNVALTINGGNIYVEASGDGLDSNGNIYINGGTVLVDGPTSSGNGALDCNGEFQINGGTLLAAGSSGMAESPDSTSTQNVVAIFFTETMPANMTVQIKTETGTQLFSYTSIKSFQLLVASSELLTTGETYEIYTNNELYKTFTITDTITQVGQNSGTNMGMGGRTNQGTHERMNQMQTPDNTMQPGMMTGSVIMRTPMRR